MAKIKIKFQRHAIAVTVGAILATGCAINPTTGQTEFKMPESIKKTFASDDPCSNNARNIGMVGGAVAGLLVAKATGSTKLGAAVVAGVIGSGVGYLIGSDIDRKRCALSKIAKQYDLDYSLSEITVADDAASSQTATAPIDTTTSAGASSTEPPTKPSVIGSTLVIRAKDESSGQFEVDSDKLTDKAKLYFAAIAEQYNAPAMLGDKPDSKTQTSVQTMIANRKLFLIGHTDDTGSSQLNASLSERRAKAVAAFLKEHGINGASLYYQGAGETIPIADNATDAGRAQNRRVEIVEVADEANFKKYLEARKPNYQFYRPTTAVAKATLSDITNSTGAAQGAASNANSGGANTVATKPQIPTLPWQTAPVPLTKQHPAIDFGGQPYTPSAATLVVGAAISEKSSFSFISKANASDTPILGDCTSDRPRNSGAVKALSDGKIYKTSEHLPQLYGKTWATDVNGNLVVINHLTVLRDGAAPANLPEFKVYALYKPNSKKPPEINEKPQVNTYLVGQGVLYRMFTTGSAGLKCADMLLPVDGSTAAKGGKLIYAVGSDGFVADFKPQAQIK